MHVISLNKIFLSNSILNLVLSFFVVNLQNFDQCFFHANTSPAATNTALAVKPIPNVHPTITG